MDDVTFGEMLTAVHRIIENQKVCQSVSRNLMEREWSINQLISVATVLTASFLKTPEKSDRPERNQDV